MIKNIKRLISINLVLLVLISVVSPVVEASSPTVESNSTKIYQDINSPEDFINAIEKEIAEKSNMKRMKSGTSNSNQEDIVSLTKDLNLFKSFPKEKQEKFIEILNDEDITLEIMKNLTENFEEINTKESKEIKVNEYSTIEVGVNETEDTLSISPLNNRAGNRQFYRSAYGKNKTFGIVTLEIECYIRYTSNGDKIIGYSDYGARLNRSWNPILSLDISTGRPYYSYNKRTIYTDTTVSYGIKIKDLGPTFGTTVLTLAASYGGGVSISADYR